MGVRQRAVVCIRAANDDLNLEVPEQECGGLVKPFQKEKCNEGNPCPGQGRVRMILKLDI